MYNYETKYLDLIKLKYFMIKNINTLSNKILEYMYDYNSKYKSLPVAGDPNTGNLL